MTKKHKRYIGKEDNFQKTVALYLNSLLITGKPILWTHVANERKGEVKTNSRGFKYSPIGTKLKTMGVKSGVPDVMIFEPSADGKYVGLAIELKANSNKPKPTQKEWIASLNERGWFAIWSNSLDEVLEIINSYFNI